MNNFILEVEKWFNSDENTKIIIKGNVDSFDYYPIDKDIFLYDENVAKEKLINACISTYFKNVEEYIGVYIKNFRFSNYSNFVEFTKSTDDETMIYFLEWFKEENIDNLKELFKYQEKGYNIKHLYSVIKYYDFLVKNSLENHNYEASLDFLVDFICSVMSKSLELTDKEEYNNKELYTPYRFNADIPESNITINKKDLVIDSNRNVINNLEYGLKSADKQAFLLKRIELLKGRWIFKWIRSQKYTIMIFN